MVGIYDLAGFPRYAIASDGYPNTADVDYRMLIGYAANADRYEDWIANDQPLQRLAAALQRRRPAQHLPARARSNRDTAGNFKVTGQIQDGVAAHTASDIVLSAYGRGASAFTGVMDNTDVFFKAAQAAIGGPVQP